jgi:hypothetical protein
MRPILFVAAAAALAAPAPPAEKFVCIDLTDKCNHKLVEKFGGDNPENVLPLKAGEDTFEGVKFQIGEGVIQLGSKMMKDDPVKVEGIKVGKAVARLHFLHATAYGRGPNVAGSAEYFVEDGTTIGEYKVHYDDETAESIPVVYGEDVRDWWFGEDEKGPSRGKVAWKAANEAAKKYDCGVRLYLTTWKNPRPDKKVVAIDYVGRKDDTVAAPFCVAITAEEK